MDKKILKWDSAELESAGHLFFNEEQYSFLCFTNSLDAVSDAVLFMTAGRWKILSSVLRILSGHYDINFYVYENPCGLLFDTSVQFIENKDDTAVFIEEVLNVDSV